MEIFFRLYTLGTREALLKLFERVPCVRLEYNYNLLGIPGVGMVSPLPALRYHPVYVLFILRFQVSIFLDGLTVVHAFVFYNIASEYIFQGLSIQKE